jgi:AcrR family transcriptional regulator
MAKIPPERREAHDESRRRQIAEAALRVWLREGFHQASVEDIAREAGLGKGTLYLYFPTKEAVLEAVIGRFSVLHAIEDWIGKIREIPPEQAVRALVSTLWQKLKERTPALTLVLSGGALRPDNTRVFLERVMMPGNRLVAEYLDHCVERGALRPMDTFIAARALVGSVVMFMLSQHVLGGAELHPMSDDAIVETLSDLFLRGALPPAAE